MYLVEIDDQNRESESIRHLLTGPLLNEYLLEPMGLGSLSWIIAEINNIQLIPSIVGEVDILAGSLQLCEPGKFLCMLAKHRAERPDWSPSLLEYLAANELAEAGGIVWPPVPSYVVGIEVKCCYFSEGLHATKKSRRHVHKIRSQIDRLAAMGFDRMALLDVIGNPTATGENANPWFEAAGRAKDSLKAMQGIIEARLPDDTAAAQLVWSVGSIAEGDESMRGASVPRIVRPGVANPALEGNDVEVASNRKTLLQGITRALEQLPRPTFFPAMFAGCRTCSRLRPVGSLCTCSPPSRVSTAL